MGRAISKYTNPINPFHNFNIESRAHKVIGKEKPTPAPKHKSDEIDMKRLMKDYPDVYRDSLKKHVKLDENLRNVYVESVGKDPVIDTSTERPLPADRHQVMDFEFGVKEPKNVQVGKVTLKNALKFITDHQSDKAVHSVANIAKQYLVPEETIKNVLQHYRIYEVYIPQQRKAKAKFAGPSVSRIKVTVNKRKQLASAQADIPKIENKGET